MNELGQRIKRARLDAKLSQRELASQVGVSYPHISKIEVGVESASSELLTKIADVVGISADELLFLAKRMPEHVEETVLAKKDLATAFLRKWQVGEISDDEVRALLNSKSNRA